MKEILNHLFEHKTLYKSEAKEILKNMAQGQYPAAQMTAFITVFLMRSITVEELEGFREAMLELCIPVDIADFQAIDVCGTGGDGKDTFNISTLSAFVLAACGVYVAKHGNYGVSSVAGSSSMLEYLGYGFSQNSQRLRRDLERHHICFMHAPLFHPAMKVIAPIRKELGVKTFFNMLGPMVNPASPPYQLVGVFSLELARAYTYLYQKMQKKFTILYSIDGYDEISLTAPFKVFSHVGETLYNPAMLGFPTLLAQDLHGGKTLAEAAKIFVQILEGEGTMAQNQAVVANAGFALQCVMPHLPLEACFEQAKEALLSKKAWQVFKSFMQSND